MRRVNRWRRATSSQGITSGLQTYGHALEVMDGWAARFLNRLDEIHGYTKR